MQKLISILGENSGLILEMAFSLIKVVVILLIGLIIAKIIAKAVRKLLASIKIDSLADKLHEIDIIQKSNVKIVPSLILSKIVYYLILFIFLSAAAEIMQMKMVSKLIADLIAYIPNLVVAMFILAIGLWVADALRGLVNNILKSLSVPGAGFISGFLFYFLLVNVVLMAMDQAAINAEFLMSNVSLVFGGIMLAFAIGYGFASRDIMSNLLGGLYSKNKVDIGDKVGIEGHIGTVIGKDSTSLTLQTEAGSNIIIPLGKLVSNNVEKL